jgi:peptidoglycan biosynthesis protein MviN/MurJ (putative lipid II flippase)
MPPLTRWHIKSAFLYLAGAMLLGVALALGAVVAMPSWLAYLSPAFFHLIMVGWVTQLIFGVIFWMFPIVSKARPRGSERLGWATYVLLNVGLILRVLSEPLNAVNPRGAWGWGLVVSAVLQWLAAVCFVVNAWPRVKERYRGE